MAYRPAPVANIAGRRLLLVDDNPTNLRILALQTQRWGFLTAVASSGAAALELLDRRYPLDATIIDVQMPEMDGYTLAEEIRRRRIADILADILAGELRRARVRRPSLRTATHTTGSRLDSHRRGL